MKMKKEYPCYWHKKGLKMIRIEKRISNEDKEILEQYLRDCRVSAGEDKVMQRKRYVLQFWDITECNFSKFNKETMEGVYTLIKNTNRENIGKNEVIKNLKKFFVWLVKKKIVNISTDDFTDLMDRLKIMKVKDGINSQKINSNTLIKEEEAEALIKATTDIQQRTHVIFHLEAGVRNCESLILKWSDILFDENTGTALINVYSPKTGETREIPIKHSVPFLLDWKNNAKYNKLSDYVFPNEQGERLNSHYLTMLFRRLCKRAGIRNIFPYLARHTTLTNVYKNCSDSIASKYAGHSPEMGRVYTHLDNSQVIEGVLKNVYEEKVLTKEGTTDLKKIKKDNKALKETVNELIKSVGILSEKIKMWENLDNFPKAKVVTISEDAFEKMVEVS